MPVELLPPAGEPLVLDERASHHALNVLRLPRGAALIVFDGSGREAPAELADVEGGRAVLTVTGPARSAAPRWPLHLVLGVTKGPAMDLAVRVATEAGATDLHPVLCERSVARGDRAERWERIAVSAAQQCGRADVPTVHPVRPLRDALAALPADLDLRIALPGAARAEPATGPAAVCVGPEGGFSEAEVAAVLEGGARPVGLGRWVLRADTAAAVACALTSPAD